MTSKADYKASRNNEQINTTIQKAKTCIQLSLVTTK
jgi:hypothetical protein